MERSGQASARSYDGLLVDYGGVLTSSLWESFDAFCRTEGLPEGTIRRQFRDEPDALADFRSAHEATFTMFSDPDSEVIRDFGILNTTIAEDDHPWYGIPYLSLIHI